MTLKPRRRTWGIAIFYFLATILGFYVLGNMDPAQLQQWLQRNGHWTPIVYILLYVVATIFILPSTILNLSGGALFGLWFGTLWTSLAAVIAATVTFWFARTIGRDLIDKRLGSRWRATDAEIRSGGFFYIFAIRLLPIIPYGLVNFTAGMTSIRFCDYFWGTTFGTVLGILPFVMLGSFGLEAWNTGEVLPLIGALGLIGVLIAGATWYRRHHSVLKPSKSRIKK